MEQTNTEPTASGSGLNTGGANNSSNRTTKSTGATDVAKCKALRTPARSSLTKATKAMDALLKDKNTPLEEIEDQLTLLLTRAETLGNLDQSILSLINDPDVLEKEATEVEAYYEKYNFEPLKIKAQRIVRKANGANGSAQGSTTGSSSNITVIREETSRLPTLVLPKFSGDITEWAGFWSRFETTFKDKPKTTKVEKFNYLYSFLEGDAKKTLIGMKATEENYDEAIKILTERFDRKDLVIHTHGRRLMNLEPVSDSSDTLGLRNLYDKIQLNVRCLKGLGVEATLSGTFICPRLIECLPKDLRLEYSKEHSKDGDWNLKAFTEFLQVVVESRETCALLGESKNKIQTQTRSYERRDNSYQNHSRTTNSYDNARKYVPTSNALITNVTPRSVYCIFCKNSEHAATNCNKYTLEEKRNTLRNERRCYICLKQSHDARRCDSIYQTCRICKFNHNQAVCPRNGAHKRSENPVQTRSTNSEETRTINANTIFDNERRNVLLQTAQILIKNPDYPQGQGSGPLKLVLDNGSQGTFVLSEVAEKLQLPVIGETRILVSEFGNQAAEEKNRKIVRLTVQNISDPEKKIQVEAVAVPFICRAQTQDCQEIRDFVQKTGVVLADDPQMGSISNSKISLLIGGDYYWEVVKGKTERLQHKLVAMDTLFGWTIEGPLSSPKTNVKKIEIKNNLITVMTTKCQANELTEIVRNFWDLEAIGIQNKPEKLSEGDDVLEKFERDVKFNQEDGRYEVKFPWNTEKDILPNNLQLATKRASSLAKRFNKNPEYYNAYKNIINEQLELGIAEIVPKNEETSRAGTYYMPHQGVSRAESQTTKLRAVLDGSAHEDGVPSLNDCLSSGPNLNPDLLLLLLSFRTYPVAIVADIEKAFLQVSLAKEERDTCRFLWVQEEGNGMIKENQFTTLRMARVPFGVTSSPYLLAATIKHHIRKYQATDQKAVDILDSKLYVDDLVAGDQEVESAFLLSKRMSIILSEANMNLRKWQSNSPELRQRWGEEAANPNTITKFEVQTPNGQKILGLQWNPNTDAFSFDLSNLIEILKEMKFTKRFALSAVSQIFDPIGILAPYTIRAKFLLQSLWEKKTKWDEKLTGEIAAEFGNWCKELPELRKIEIPRYYFDGNQADQIIKREIHCFCDACTKAYAAVVYVRYELKNGKIGVSLVTSKSRVAPLKGIDPSNEDLSLPRLELMGCVLGARLVNNIKEIFGTEEIETFMWSDSTIALHWVKGSTKVWKPFVQNRAVEIQKLSNPKIWQHCPGIQNPADIPTRGAHAEELCKNETWWQGPAWLKKEKSEWPVDKMPELNSNLIEKEKRKTILAVTTTEKSGINKIMDLNKWNDLDKILRITSYVIRAIQYLRKKKTDVGVIKTVEILHAENLWIRCIQNEDFPEEIIALENKEEIEKSSKIAELSPILNQNKIICVGGRLSEADLEYEIKHPIILKKEQRLARLIMDRCHYQMMHGGIQSTLTQSREKYWVTAGRQLARKSVKSCLQCRKAGVKPGDAPTAPLPKDRIEQSPSFEIVGIDFAGPLYVKVPGGGVEKSYICLFTCAVTRAIHLELVTSLNTKDFLLAFTRMISRRGIPRKVYTDNAKTFNRASKDLGKIWQNLKSDDVINFYGKKGITWHFIVERAAWYGGWWEILVKSTKSILKKNLGNASLTHVEMETILVETEAAINSRPITYVSSEANDPQPLTPSHFLIGKRLTSLPPQIIKNEKGPKTQTDMNNRLKYRSALMTRLWNRWKKEYLLELRSAHKIKLATTKSKIKIGDVMMINDANIQKHLWKLGVVVEVFEGRDGIIRSCMVRTSNGHLIRRPIQLLYALEIDAISVRENSENQNV